MTTRNVCTLSVVVDDIAVREGVTAALGLVVDDEMAVLVHHVMTVGRSAGGLEGLERRHVVWEGVALVAIEVVGLLAQLVFGRAAGLGEVDEVDRRIVLPSSGEDAENGGRGHGDLDHGRHLVVLLWFCEGQVSMMKVGEDE